MTRRKFQLHDGKKGAALAVRVTPRASKTKIVDLLEDGTLKVHLAAPPVDEETNQELLKFMADVLVVPKNRLDIVAGLAGRDKLIAVLDMDADTAHKRILAYLE